MEAVDHSPVFLRYGSLHYFTKSCISIGVLILLVLCLYMLSSNYKLARLSIPLSAKKSISGASTLFTKMSHTLAIIRHAAGVYPSSIIDITKPFDWPYPTLSPKDISRTVIVVSANSAYTDFTVNFLCHLNLVYPTGFKYVVVPQDTKFSVILQRLNITYISGHLIGVAPAISTAESFRSPNFNQISAGKLQAALFLLQTSHNLVFSDIDLVWLRDPLSYFRADIDADFQSNFDHDLFISSNDELNSGFYFMRSNHKTISLIQRTIQAYKEDPTVDDQTHLTEQVRFDLENGTAVYIPPNHTNNSSTFQNPLSNGTLFFRNLPPLQFPSGLTYLNDLEKYKKRKGNRTDIPVVVHANWIDGGHQEKKAKLQKSGHWLADEQKLNDCVHSGCLQQWRQMCTLRSNEYA